MGNYCINTIVFWQNMAASFAQFKTLESLTSEEKTQLHDHCYKRVGENDTHYFHHGKDGLDYGKVTFTLRGVRYGFRRHLLALFLHLLDTGYEMSQWTESFEASHLCHKKRCFRVEHLILEPRATNRKRDSCATAGRCLGHESSPECIL